MINFTDVTSQVVRR